MWGTSMTPIRSYVVGPFVVFVCLFLFFFLFFFFKIKKVFWLFFSILKT